MKSMGVSIKVVIASLVIALVLLFGGREVLIRTSVSLPMEHALDGMPEVASYSLDKTPRGMVLEVELRGVRDLDKTMKSLSDAVSAVNQKNGVLIKIDDSRDEGLSEAYYHIHFAVQEAIATGSFTEMESQIEKDARELGLERWRVVVDADSVYVSLARGGHELYEVVPRRMGDLVSSRPAQASTERSGVRIW